MPKIITLPDGTVHYDTKYLATYLFDRYEHRNRDGIELLCRIIAKLVAGEEMVQDV